MCGTTEHTQVLANILRDRRKRDRHFVMAQFDLVNAFGSPPREVLLKVMQWARLDPGVIAYITSLYDGATMELKLQAGLSAKIPVNRGVLQGDTLSPILFNLVMEVALRFVRHAFPNLGIRHDGELHFQKAYADDVTFLTVTPEDMQQATNAFAAVLKRLGMEINVKKSRIHCTAHTRPHVNDGRQGYMTQRPNILADGLIPHVCDKGRKFLGAIIKR
eukprot:PhF_6_TR13451/c2_g3_i5/m.21534